MTAKKQNQLKVTYAKSVIGYNQKQIKIIEALGFRKLGQTKLFPDNASIRGSIFHVKHLLKVEEVK